MQQQVPQATNKFKQPLAFLKSSTLLVCLGMLFLHQIAMAQRTISYPDYLINPRAGAVAVTLYARDAQKLVHIYQNKMQYYGIDGKPMGIPITIRPQLGDLLQPRISPSGQSLCFYKEPEMFTDDGRLFFYHTDSAAVLGSARVPAGSDLKNMLFRGDSTLQFQCDLKDIQIQFRLSLKTGRINRSSLFEDSAGIAGLYSAVLYNHYYYAAVRNADTLALGYFNAVTQADSVPKFILLSSAHAEARASFSSGSPWLFVANKDAGTTDVYFWQQDTLVHKTTYNGYYDVVSAHGNSSQCMAILKDSSENYFIANGDDPHLTAIKNSSIGSQSIFETDATHGLFTVSHPTNAQIAAYNGNGQLLWQYSPMPDADKIASTEKDVQAEAAAQNLFKVFIKQGANDINDWQYDSKEDRLYLIKNNSRFIQLHPQSNAALLTQIFNHNSYRTTQTKILPGHRFIYYTQEIWQKDPTHKREGYDGKMETYEDEDKENYLYPYRASVYDSKKNKTVFEMHSKGALTLNLINDSLIAWILYNSEEGSKTVYLYNLIKGSYKTYQPFGDRYVYEEKMLYHPNGQMYFLCKLDKDSIALLNEQGKMIFHFTTGNEDVGLQWTEVVPGSSFFYFNMHYVPNGNKLFKIENDKVSTLYTIPAEAEVVKANAGNNNCYLLYKQRKKIKQQDIDAYFLYQSANGKTRYIDSVVNLDTQAALSGDIEMYPARNIAVIKKDDAINWIDLQTATIYKNFGREDPSIISICYSADGRYLAAANPYGKVMLWDLGTGKETRTLYVAKGGYITRLAFSGDGKYLAASSGDIWETASGKNVVSVTDGSIWKVNSIDFSADGKRIVSAGTCIISWDAADGSKIMYQQYPREKDKDTTGFCFNQYGCIKDDYPLLGTSVALHPNGRSFVTGNVSGLVQQWNTENDSLYRYQILYAGYNTVNKSVTNLAFSRNGRFIIATQQNCIYKLDAETLKVTDSLLLPPMQEIVHIDMDYSHQLFGCINKQGNKSIVQLRSLQTLEIVKEFEAYGAGFNQLSFSPNKKQVATSSEDGFCTIWDLTSYQPVLYLNNIGEYGNVMVTPDNYYMSSKSALEGVGFLKNNRYYSFEQFDLYLNRPDIVLQRLGYASPELIAFYHAAYLKRLKRNGIADTTLQTHIPSLSITNSSTVANVTRHQWQSLQLSITDSLPGKGQLMIYINAVPVKQISISSNEPRVTITDSVQLSNGSNKIEAVYISSNGTQSEKEQLLINYAPLKPKPGRVWFVGVALAQYRNPALALKYPVKDVRDLAKAIRKKYPTAVIDTLLNEQATRENILTLKQKLLQTQINDIVIVSFNGHGMLSDSLNWYFAGYAVDAAKPSANSVSYQEMENLLSNIPARKKLLLIDACHSGEVDKEANTGIGSATSTMEQNVKEINVNTRGNEVLGKSKAGLQASFEMMQELFANLNNNSGTTVLSAAGGREYALESDTWKNGVFTYSILEALSQKELTDKNADKKISVKELKQQVFDRVKALTGGRQKPTSRLEIPDDWMIW